MNRISGDAFLADLRNHPHSSPSRHSHLILDSEKWLEMKITMEGKPFLCHSYTSTTFLPQMSFKNDVGMTEWGEMRRYFLTKAKPFNNKYPSFHPHFIISTSFISLPSHSSSKCHSDSQIDLFPRYTACGGLLTRESGAVSYIRDITRFSHFKVIPSSFGHHLMAISSVLFRMRGEWLNGWGMNQMRSEWKNRVLSLI